MSFPELAITLGLIKGRKQTERVHKEHTRRKEHEKRTSSTANDDQLELSSVAGIPAEAVIGVKCARHRVMRVLRDYFVCKRCDCVSGFCKPWVGATCHAEDEERVVHCSKCGIVRPSFHKLKLDTRVMQCRCL
jgi:hypothetical protein